MIDHCFLFDNEDFEIHYKINFLKTIYNKSEVDLIEIINFTKKINKLKFEEIPYM